MLSCQIEGTQRVGYVEACSLRFVDDESSFQGVAKDGAYVVPDNCESLVTEEAINAYPLCCVQMARP